MIDENDGNLRMPWPERSRYARATFPPEAFRSRADLDRYSGASCATKTRLHHTLNDAQDAGFGDREEYRIAWKLFQALNLDLVPNDTNDGTGLERHPPYWILETKVVHDFMRWELNRWILAIELLHSRVKSSPGYPIDSRSEQLQNAAMGSALLRSLKRSIGDGFLCSDASLYRAEFKTKNKDGTDRVTKLGLNYQQTIARYGLAWLPVDIINWEHLRFHVELLPRLSFTRNGLQATFHDQKKQKLANSRRLNHEDLVVRLRTVYEAHDADETEVILETMRHIIYAAFVRTLFTSRRRFFPGLRYLNEDELRGYHGLSMSIVTKAIQHTPKISLPKGKLRNGEKAQLSRYKFDWVQRLHGLFDWNDGIDRKWENLEWRRIAKEFYSVIRDVTTVEVADIFKTTLGERAAQYLWVIPSYDGTHLIQSQKPTKHHSKATFERLKALPAAQRQLWFAAYRSDFLEQEDENDPGFPLNLKDHRHWSFVRRKDDIAKIPTSRPSIMSLAKHVEVSISFGDLTASRVGESEEENEEVVEVQEQAEREIAILEPRLGQRRSSRETRKVNYTDV